MGGVSNLQVCEIRDMNCQIAVSRKTDGAGPTGRLLNHVEADADPVGVLHSVTLECAEKEVLHFVRHDFYGNGVLSDCYHTGAGGGRLGLKRGRQGGCVGICRGEGQGHIGDGQVGGNRGGTGSGIRNSIRIARHVENDTVRCYMGIISSAAEQSFCPRGRVSPSGDIGIKYRDHPVGCGEYGGKLTGSGCLGISARSKHDCSRCNT